MTEGSASVGVVGVAGALFCVLMIYLALQIRAGNDPAIGAGHEPAAPARRAALVRRVIITRVIEEDAPVAAGPATSSAAGAAPAPAPAAAAPAPASPAPAPVVSGGS